MTSSIVFCLYQTVMAGLVTPGDFVAAGADEAVVTWLVAVVVVVSGAWHDAVSTASAMARHMAQICFI